MVNPDKITNYNLNNKALQEHAIFWLLVAGKTAKVISKRMQLVIQDLQKLWDAQYGKQHRPKYLFELIRRLSKTRRGSEWLADILQNDGIGCQNTKAKGMIQLACSDLNLRTCTPDDLEKIHGIGMKTSRCFILHSRENAQYSGLDTHLLKCLRDLGHEVPESTPGSKKKYKEIEQLFLNIANKTHKTPAELDLIIWRVYSSHKHLKPILINYLIKR